MVSECVRIPTQGAVCVVEPDRGFAEQLAARLEERAFPCTRFDCGGEVLQQAKPHRYACFVVNHVLPDMSGLDMLVKLRRWQADAQVVMLGESWFLADVVQAMKQGATEVLEKRLENSRLLEVIEQSVRQSLEHRQPRWRTVPGSLRARLTSEEGRLFELLMRGYTAKQVSVELDISVRTMHYRKKELLRKLGVLDRAGALELCRLASEQEQCI
jgi:FixJ family two-component response regulator